MTARRAPPGEQLSVGRIRVDAAKALAKLRAYRLTDPTAWILEAIRAAIASGATRVALAGDADDVWLAWDGPTWPADELPGLFDELVSPEQGGAYPRRLLANAINSGLGVDPQWIDVTAVDGGVARRVRFQPRSVDAAGEEQPGERPAVEDAPRPDRVGESGMLLHLRRGLDLGVVVRFLRGAEPPEVVLARAACADVAVPMTIDGVAIGRGEPGADLMREPLGEGLDGFVALIEPGPTPAGAALDVAELGVRVTRDPWRPAALEALALADRCPLRLFIDAPRLATNASRSQVRHDAHPIDAALRRADAVTPALIGRLVEALAARPDEALRAAALALIAGATASDGWGAPRRGLDGPVAALAALPLVRNAVGAWRPVSGRWRRAVHRGDQPLPAALAPWLDELAWMPPGDPATCLLGPVPASARDTRVVIDEARRRWRRHQEFLERPVREAQVEQRAESRVRARLGAGPAGCIAPSVLAGLTGDVCVAAGAGPGRVTLLLEDRALEVAPLDGPLAIDAIVGGAPLAPDPRYQRAEDDEGRRRAVRAARAGAIRAIEALCGDDAEPGVTIAAPRRAPDDGALIRGALALALADGHPIGDDTPLARAAVWPTLGGALLSLAELRRGRAVGAVKPGADALAPSGRAMVVADAGERALLAALVAPSIVVPYRGAQARPSIDPGQALIGRVVEQTGAAALVIRTDAHSGAIAFADHSTLALAHRGVVLAEVARAPAVVDCAIAIDSDAVVPTPDWRGLHDDGGVASAELADWERALVIAAAHALVGDATPDLHVPQRPIRLDDPTGRRLCAALVRDGLELLDPALVARLRAHPMLHALAVGALISVDELARAFPRGALPVVRLADLDDADRIDDGWHPLIADDDVRRLVRKLAGRATIDAGKQLATRRAATIRAGRLAALRSRPPSPVTLPDACAPMPIGGELRGVIGCAPAPADPLEVVLSFEGRRCGRLVSSPDLPALAAIEVELADLDDQLDRVRPDAHDRLLRAVRHGVARWLAAAAETRPTALADDPPTRRLLAAWLARSPDDPKHAIHEQTRATLRAAPSWPTIQGGRCALAAATRARSVQTATWTAPWLPGPPAHVLDEPVIALPPSGVADELRAILEALGPGSADDVTAGVRRLQTERRIARGVIAPPSVPGANAALSRRLDALGVAHALGAGMIALADAAESTLLVHHEGELRTRIAIDVVPAVHLAIEGPELLAPDGDAGPLRPRVRALATALLAAIVAAGTPLPSWLRRRLRRAVLAGAIDPALIAAAPIFDTAGGVLVRWSDVLAQQQQFGDVWVITAAPPGPPLDPARLVLRLDDDELGGARTVALTQAHRQLELDAVARANQRRAPVAALEVPAAARAGALAQLDLPAGVVVVLRPTAAMLRGVLAHRGLVPFDRVADPCAWPTLAIVEDPALTPDRTWSQPLRDAAWVDLAERIRTASRDALAAIVEAPADAAAAIAITAWSDDGSSARAVAGSLWLEPHTDEPRAGTVVVSTPTGDVELDAPDGLPIHGRLLVFPDPPDLPAAVAALCRRWLPTLRTRDRSAPPAPAIPAPPPPVLAPIPPPHPLRRLAIALRARLQQLGDAGRALTGIYLVAGITSPLVAPHDGGLALAGDAPLLRDLAAALATGALRADGGVDALAAHALTVLRHAGTIDELAALQQLLAD